MKDSSDSEKRDVSRAVVGFRVCIRNRRGFPPRYSGVHRFGWEEFCVDAWFCACAVLFLNHWLPEGCREVLGKNPMTEKLYYVVRLVNREDLLKDDGGTWLKYLPYGKQWAGRYHHCGRLPVTCIAFLPSGTAKRCLKCSSPKVDVST